MVLPQETDSEFSPTVCKLCSLVSCTNPCGALSMVCLWHTRDIFLKWIRINPPSFYEHVDAFDPCWVFFVAPNAVCLLRSLYNFSSTEMCFTEWEIHSLIRSCPLWRHNQVELECSLCWSCSLWQGWLDLCDLWRKSHPKLWHLRVQLWSETLPTAAVKPPQQQYMQICDGRQVNAAAPFPPEWLKNWGIQRLKRITEDGYLPNPVESLTVQHPWKFITIRHDFWGALKYFQPKSSELNWDKRLFLSLWNSIFQHSCPTAVTKTAGPQGDHLSYSVYFFSEM